MDLNEIRVFAKVVKAGSFIAASRDLGMPKSTVSRKLAELEARLGARLLQRTTRKLSLTDIGQAFYRHAIRVVDEAEAAERVVSELQEVPRGLLRVTTPLNFRFLGPMATAFLRRYPEVQIDMVCTDRVVDLVHEGFDLALRAGPLADSSLIARSLGALRSYIVASPDFVRRHGKPKAPRELTKLDCVVFGAGAERSSWRFIRHAESLTVEVKTRFTVNDFDVLEEAVRAGLGVAKLPAFRCIEQLRSGELIRLLDDWSLAEIALHAVYPSTRYLSPTVKAFVDHLRAYLTPPSWENGPVP